VSGGRVVWLVHRTVGRAPPHCVSKRVGHLGWYTGSCVAYLLRWNSFLVDPCPRATMRAVPCCMVVMDHVGILVLLDA
jgi:hypothetical protein